MSQELIPHTVIDQICGSRDAALEKMREAARMLGEGYQLAREAEELAAQAHGGAKFYLRDRTKEAAYGALFAGFNAELSLDTYRRHLDACVWTHVLSCTGMSDLMDRTAKEELDKALCEDVPEFTADNAWATFQGFRSDADTIFRRGIARCFSELDRRFRSHDGFKVGARIILTNVFDGWGYFNYHSRMRDAIADIERVFAVLDNKHPNPGALARAIEDDRRGRSGARQSVTETDYFTIRCFQNGNAHLWFKRDDLVDKVNLLLGEYYGEVLADSMPASGKTADDLRSTTGALSKDLAFYPTPPKVISKMMSHTYIPKGARVLEPSAGTGNIVHYMTTHEGVSVDAIEVDAARVATMQARFAGQNNITVQQGNFLDTPATPIYDMVVMNPPFAGTHWMEHVLHAFDFLKPGGKLLAILPVTAEVGHSEKHETFRNWAEKHRRNHRMFHDLPEESFKDAGTLINTVVLSLTK